MPSGRIGRSKASALTRAPGDTQKSTHGGARPGAGRPKEVDSPTRHTVYLDQRHVKQINRWQETNGGTFSEALRDLLDYADSVG